MGNRVGSSPTFGTMSWGTHLLPRCKGKILLTEKQILNTVNILLTVFFYYLGLLGTRMVARELKGTAAFSHFKFTGQ